MNLYKSLFCLSLFFISCTSHPKLFVKNSYSGLYSYKHHQSLYVKYTLSKHNINGKVKRTNNFKIDTLLDKTNNLNAYHKSGFDRGHLKPAATSKASKNDMNESFLLSNISPQHPDCNRKTWKRIESFTRSLILDFDTIQVYSGPIFRPIFNQHLKKSNITIPIAFFKAIKLNDSTTIGFICKNKKTNSSILEQVVSINQIESKIKFNLFPELSETIEKRTNKILLDSLINQ